MKTIKNSTHFLLLGNDLKVIEKSMDYFAANRVVVINSGEAGQSDMDNLRKIFEPRVTVVEKVINGVSILESAKGLMEIILDEILETRNDIFFNFSRPSQTLAMSALMCSQLAGITSYRSIIHDSIIEKIEYLPLLPFTDLSSEQFALLSVLVFSSNFDTGSIVNQVNKQPNSRGIWEVIFPNLTSSGQDTGKLIKNIHELTTKTDKGKFLNSLDDLVTIINPSIEKPGKKYNSERARLSYHLQKMKGYNLIESRKEKRKIMLRASWAGIMFFMGTIVKNMENSTGK